MKERTGSWRIVALAVLGLGLWALVGGVGAPSPLLAHPAAREAAPPAQKPPPEARPETLVLRLYFSDVFERDRLALEWGADEMSTVNGYLTVWADRATYEAMLAKGLKVEIDAATTAQANNPVLFGNSSPESFYGSYKTVEEMQTFLDQKVAANPTLAEKIDFGNSWCKDHPGACTRPSAYNGYDLWVLHITNRAIPGPKPVFWFDAGIHSREIGTPEVAMRYISWLLDNYATNADAHWLVDYQDIWVVPMLNPDGHHIVEAGGSSPYSQRKNANNTNGCTTWPPTSSTQFGVDLNRNFPFLWNCCGGSSGSACTQTYHGVAAGSEPETQYVVNKVRSLIPDQRGPNNTDAAPLTTTGMMMSMHSYSNLNLYPWGWTTTASPNNADLANIGQHMSATNASPAGNGYQSCASPNCLYAVDGDSVDWAYGELGVPAYTTEIEGNTFFPSYSTIDSAIWPHNQGMLIYLTKIAATPYLLTRGPDTKNVAATPMTVSVGTPAQLAATINYAWTSNGYSQNVAAAEYYVDTPPWAGGTATAMTATDGAFNATTENVQASVPTGSLAAGRHILFVRGRGVNSYSGNLSWGPVSAVFLDVQVGGPTATPTRTPTNTPTPSGPTDTPTRTPTNTPTPVSTCNEALTNPGFESGTAPWVASAGNGHTIVSTTRPHSGSFSALLGGYNRATDQIYQQITIPSTATSATLSYWWYMTTKESTHPWDFLYTRIQNSSGTTLATLQTVNDGSTANTWVHPSFDLTAYKGQTIRVAFVATTDRSQATTFFVDDASVNICQ
jgi:hypothetical protein